MPNLSILGMMMGENVSVSHDINRECEALIKNPVRLLSLIV